MRVLVTGATGFIGQYLVEALLGKGHEVRATYRSPTAPAVASGVELVRLDLRSSDGLAAALAGIDVVIHAAAVKDGPRTEQYEGTATATQHLLRAMAQVGVTRIVLVSSFAVYVGEPSHRGRCIDESSPIGVPATARDTYCEMKLLQEGMLEEAARTNGWSATVARPGFVFGSGNLWSNRLGYRRGQQIWLCVGGRATLPLSYVANCADALVHLAEATVSGIRTINIIDAPLPTQAEYRRQLIDRIGRPRLLLVVPWPVVHASLWLLDRVDRLLGRRLRIPGALRLETGRARWQPTRYDNQSLRGLGWEQPVILTDALDAATASATDHDST